MADKTERKVPDSRMFEGDSEPDLQAKIEDLEHLKLSLTIKDLEVNLLLLFVRYVIDQSECLCGVLPFTDGDPCCACEGRSVLERWHAKNYLPTETLPEDKTMIVDLDKLNNLLIYLGQINNTLFEKMVFIRDKRPIKLAETLETLIESGMSNVDILKRVYQLMGREAW